MNKIQETFENHFHEDFGIKLSEELFKTKKTGEINKSGWAIQICFGKKDGKEYMDFYAMHRMIDDRHVRIWEDGYEDILEAQLTWRKCSKDPIEDEKLLYESNKRHQELNEVLLKKFSFTDLNYYLIKQDEEMEY